MKLLQAIVRRYRIHGEVKVDFAQGLNLIGGPNESGKSTLIEAVHRALFLRSRASGEILEGMRSKTHPGAPEVEVTFAVGGVTWRLHKRFGGPNGSTTLSAAGGTVLHGEEAEAKLATLLRTPDLGGGRGVGERLLRQWAHLWVWQGKSGEDPAHHTETYQADLLQRLQTLGGAAAQMSELDQRVAERLSSRRKEMVLDTGRPKANSDLDRATKDMESAEKTLREAQGRHQQLLEAIRTYEEANAGLRACDLDQARIIREQEALQARLERAQSLQNQGKLQEVEATQAQERWESLENTRQRMAKLAQSLQDLAANLTPCETELQRLQTALAEADRYEQELRTEEESVRAQTLRQRTLADLARVHFDCLAADARLVELQAKEKDAAQVRSQLEGIRHQLARLPVIDDRELRKLQQLESKRGEAEAALQAVAAGLEVIEAGRPVRVGETDLPAGRSLILTETTEIVIGADVRLRLKPGGGEGLEGARTTADKARQKLEEALLRHAIASFEKAAEIASTRNELASQAGQADVRLKSYDDGTLAKTLVETRLQRESYAAEVQRIQAQLPDPVILPDSAEAAKLGREETARLLRDAEEREVTLRPRVAAANRNRVKCHEGYEKAHRDRQKLDQERGQIEAQLRLLREQHGAEEQVARLLGEAAVAREEAARRLQETKRQLDELQPESLERDRLRLQRAQENKTQERNAHLERRAASQAELSLDGSVDPQAELRRAEARAESAQANHALLQRQANALKLLDDLLTAQKQDLANLFSKPLAACITDYLRCVFGYAAQAVVTFSEGRVQGIRLERTGQVAGFAFDELSGGAREQAAAAVRFAIAELLAAGWDGSLPIVLDDAFAYSDPGRVSSLQGMLDRAASRGLQVILLTHNPSDYAPLGAQTHLLRPSQAPLPTAAARTAHPSESNPSDDEDDSEGLVGESPPRAASAPASDLASDPADGARLLEKLRDLGGRSGNKALQDALAWAPERYDTVKSALLQSGAITSGRGRGGSVSLTG